MSEEQKAVSETSFVSNGEIGALIRSLDWSQTPLGATETWSQSLKDTIQILSTELDRAKHQQQQPAPVAQQNEAQQNEAQQNEIDTLLAKISNGFYHLDRHWCFTAVNARLCEIVGMEREAIIGHSIWELFADLVDTQFDTELRRSLNEQIPTHFEYFYQPWNRWYEHWVYPSLDGLTIFGADITARMSVEAELPTQSQLLETVVNYLPSSVAIVRGQDLTFQFVKPMYQAIAPGKQMVGRTIQEVWPETQPLFAERCRRVLETGEPYYAVDEVFDMRRADGEPLETASFNWSMHPIILPSETEQGILITIWETTDHKRVEEELRQSNDRFHTAMQAVEGIVFEWNLQTQTVYRSEGLFQLIGIRAEEALPTAEWWMERLHPDDVKRMEPELSAIMTSADRYEGEYRVRHEAGHWVDVWERGYLQRNPLGEVIRVVGFTTDISDRKRAEAALQESKMRLDFSLEAAQFGDWDLDLRTHQAHRSLKHDQIFGYESLLPEWTYEMFLEHVLPEERETVDQHYRIALENNEPWNIECRICRADQQVRWIWVLGYVYFNPQGEAIRMVGLVSDISDRKQSEAALRESESQFRLIVDSAKEYAIFTINLQGYITKWNSGAERLLGYSEAEAIGCKGEIIFTPEDNEQERAAYEIRTALTEGRAENERWHLRKNGSRFWASGLMMPLLDETNTPQGVVKILQDKTAQRQASERLQLLYETTRDLLSTDQPLALIQNLFSKLSVQLDLHCYYNFMVEEKDNQLMLHLRNYDGISEEAAQELEWIHFGEYLCGMAAQERRQVIFNEAQLKTHPNAQVVYAMGVKAYAGQPLITHGRLLGTLSFASRTRTCFMPAEIELLQSTCDQIAIAIERTNLTHSLQQQAEQLRQANRIKDEFLAVLSHELRSPLNPILGWSKLLQSGSLSPAKTAQALTTIERNAKLQAELIEDLLDVSRILQGKLRLNVSAVNLAPIIEAAIETVHLAAEAKSIAMEATLDFQAGQVSGDATRLQQVVWNLLSNAVKFTPTGGHVTVQLAQVENQAQMTISDTGKGIPPNFLPYVFDYFRQEDGATTRQFGGLGLGLAIVRHLVELHGGTVQVTSPGEGLGATFTVKLPTMPVSSAMTVNRRSSEPSLDLNGIRVLVIDDETDSREFVAFVLEQAGARVTTATTASEGFAILTQSQPDVLLSDIGMPDMDGYMLMQQVRLLPPEQGGNVLAIALTAYAGDFNQQQALQAGFQQHLAKPIEPEALIRGIANLINSIT
ncbi:MAG: PAS domain S-box protein [Timaviella obliquedivisa GSE-PSE-MK23-08B]|jgi:PAS domain S-box-containing protein|nr:PAS domain S-box protein [Timaviella obliquedivisa GSE-PSE-MK23-08B]